MLSAGTATVSVNLSSLIASMNDLVAEATHRDREAYLAEERRLSDAVAKANADYLQTLEALENVRRERGAQIRAIRARADTIERERRQRLKQLEDEVEAKREAVHQKIQQQVLDAAAAFAHARRQHDILIDRVDAARALIAQYDDLASQLADVDERILALAEQEVARTEVAYQAALTHQAEREAAENLTAEEVCKATRDEIMARSQEAYSTEVAAETELVRQFRQMAAGERAVIARLREERANAIAAARAAFDEECIWHPDGKAAIEAEREVERAAAAMARAKAEAERKAKAARKAHAELKARHEAKPYEIEINALYSARRIDEVLSAAKKRASSGAVRIVEQAASERKQFVRDVRQLLSEYPKRPVEGIELITPRFAMLFDAEGNLTEIWSIDNGRFAAGDDADRKKYAGWKPGRIFHQAKQPGCIAFKFGAG